MYTINKYYKNTYLLTNSLRIKFIDAAYAINVGMRKNDALKEKFGLLALVPTEDMTTWKYFLNLAGIKHFTNNDVKIKLLESNETVSLSKEILNTYTYSKDELRKNTDYLNNLLYQYPDDYGFIMGCIYPVDINTAINAKDGTILSYDSNYVESNEYNLISEIQDWIQGFYSRYNISDFCLTDSEYFAGFLGVMMSKLPNKIVNIRLSKINTNEVHSFHLEHFFRSNLDLWENVSKLNNETKFWLYKNLDYLIKHIGSEYTFKTIIDKIFNNNNIGVGEYLLESKDDVVVTDVNNTSISYFKRDGVKFVTNKLNPSYNMDNNNNLEASTIVNLELTTVNDYDVSFPVEMVDDIIRNESNLLSNSVINKQKTKILDINTIKLFNSNGMDNLLSIMDNWLYMASNGKYQRKIYYTDPNSKVTVEVTPLEGYYILLKYLLKLNNNMDILLTTLKWSKIINSEITSPDNLINSLYDNPYMVELTNTIYDLLPNDIYNINNNEEFKTYMDIRNNLYDTVWLMDSNVSNPIVSGNIKHIVNRLFINGEVDLKVNGAGITIDGLLNKLGINFVIESNYDIYSSIKELFLTFTGINISVYEELDNDTNNYIAILNKLTSYTLQIIKSVDDMSSVFAPYTSDNVFAGDTGLATVISAKIIDPLERSTYISHCEGNNFVEDTKVDNFRAPHIVELYDGIGCLVSLPDVMHGESSITNLDNPEITIELLTVFNPVTALDNEIVTADNLNELSRGYINNDDVFDISLEESKTDLYLIDNDPNIAIEEVVIEYV